MEPNLHLINDDNADHHELAEARQRIRQLERHIAIVTDLLQIIGGIASIDTDADAA